jgi:hypothetical protein
MFDLFYHDVPLQDDSHALDDYKLHPAKGKLSKLRCVWRAAGDAAIGKLAAETKEEKKNRDYLLEEARNLITVQPCLPFGSGLEMHPELFDGNSTVPRAGGIFGGFWGAQPASGSSGGGIFGGGSTTEAATPPSTPKRRRQ